MSAGVLRNYFCPKCGAVGEVRWVRAVTQQQWDEAKEMDRAAREKYDADYQAYLAKTKGKGIGWYRSFWSPVPPEWWARASEGLEHGEHLACKCPRCAYSWRDQILADTADSPIYDELAAS